MKKLFKIFIILLCPLLVICQNLEVEGDAKINGRIIDVKDPVNAQDVATKAYVDKMSEMMLDAGLNGLVEDIDGNVYKTIKIGTQVWMAENLKTTRYNDGVAIAEVTDSAAWSNLTTPGYSWYDNDSTMNAKLYGALYNYFTVADTNSLNVCPTGWDVPTDTALMILTEYLEENGYGYGGSGADIGKSLAATFRWNSSGTAGNVGNDLGSNNSSGFAGLPGGYRVYSGTFQDVGFLGFLWSSAVYSSADAWSRVLVNTSGSVTSASIKKRYGVSVRCLRD